MRWFSLQDHSLRLGRDYTPRSIRGQVRMSSDITKVHTEGADRHWSRSRLEERLTHWDCPNADQHYPIQPAQARFAGCSSRRGLWLLGARAFPVAPARAAYLFVLGAIWAVLSLRRRQHSYALITHTSLERLKFVL